MSLKTYPRLNLPSKRLGIEVGDWLLILGSILPGVVLINVSGWLGFLVLVGFPSVVVVWATYIKPTKPRGWLSAALDYLTRNAFGMTRIIYKADHEKNANRPSLS